MPQHIENTSGQINSTRRYKKKHPVVSSIVLTIINIALTIEGTDLGDTADHTITMDDCEVTMAVAEGDPNTISLSWTVYGTVTMT